MKETLEALKDFFSFEELLEADPLEAVGLVVIMIVVWNVLMLIAA